MARHCPTNHRLVELLSAVVRYTDGGEALTLVELAVCRDCGSHVDRISRLRPATKWHTAASRQATDGARYLCVAAKPSTT